MSSLPVMEWEPPQWEIHLISDFNLPSSPLSKKRILKARSKGKEGGGYRYCQILMIVSNDRAYRKNLRR